MLGKIDKANMIKDSGIIGIIRATSSQKLIKASEAIKKGGVTAIEITMTTPGALSLISEAKQELTGDFIFGAGSVLDNETARMAIIAGADFIVTPTINCEMISMCNKYGIPVIPGCFTPSEMLDAWSAGATFIKLFPANVVGPSMVKAVLAPLPQLEIIPVGGVDENNTVSYIQSGAVAVGVGSCLINDELLEKQDFSEITRRAQTLVAKVRQGRLP
jgi:2-dehydro-3-deoxyphosphogluconate aldolase/(4S)-4-hydroxy-2-oxoglutarate aldolase